MGIADLGKEFQDRGAFRSGKRQRDPLPVGIERLARVVPIPTSAVAGGGIRCPVSARWQPWDQFKPIKRLQDIVTRRLRECANQLSGEIYERVVVFNHQAHERRQETLKCLRRQHPEVSLQLGANLVDREVCRCSCCQ